MQTIEISCICMVSLVTMSSNTYAPRYIMNLITIVIYGRSVINNKARVECEPCYNA
jgi:hypothetical protein